MRKAIKNLRLSFVGLVVFSVGVFALAAYRLVGLSDQAIDSVSSVFMEQVSTQVEIGISSKLDGYRSEMESVTLLAVARNYTDDQPSRNAFVDVAQERGFTYVAAYDESVLKGGQVDVLLGPSDLALDEEDAFFSAALAGEDAVTCGTSPEGQVVLVLGMPFQEGGKTQVLAMGIPMADLVSALELEAGTGTEVYSHVIRRDGTFVVKGSDLAGDSYVEAVASAAAAEGGSAKEAAAQLLEGLRGNSSAYYVLSLENGSFITYLMPLSGTNWYLVSVLPSGILHDPVDGLMRKSTATVLVGCALCAAAMAVVFARYYRLSREQMRRLEAARAEADAASRAKSEFLSNMSHDIRTPMNAIVGMTNIAQARLGEPDVVRDCLKKISLSSKHLLGLINDVLDMSKIESGKLALTVDRLLLPEAVENVVATVQPQVRARQQSFDVSVRDITSECVYADGVRLNQILLNLISNAIKFTPVGGRITLTVTEESSPAGAGRVRVHFWVRDTGIGMSPEFRAHVFDSFEREDTEQVRKTEGTGLGMAITKRIVDEMGGLIEVESEKGQGSCFHVMLDLERADADDAGIVPAGGEGPDLAGLRVLLAEDNELNWEVASELLGGFGMELTWARDGREAVERFEESEVGAYDVVLMDIRMPVMNGYEATRAIRALGRPDAASVPIIAMTADAFAEDREQAEAAGMNAHVAKPIDLAEVLRVIGRCAGTGRAGEGGGAA